MRMAIAPKTLYVSDLDGTLLRGDATLGARTMAVINALSARGLPFTYATARSLTSARAATRGLAVHLPAVVYNGCMLVQPDTGERLAFDGFTQEEARFAAETIRAHGIWPLVYAHAEGRERVSWVPEHENDGMRRYLSLRRGDPRMYPAADDRLFDGEPFYYTCIGRREELLPLYDDVRADGRFRCTLQQELYRPEYWCELMPARASKAAGIARLKALLGFERVVSFGDAVNDIPMFEASDECYAVENAAPELIARATGVIADCEHDGVAEWLAAHSGIELPEGCKAPVRITSCCSNNSLRAQAWGVPSCAPRRPARCYRYINKTHPWADTVLE